MKSLREAIIERINEKYIGRTFTAASFCDLPECAESDYPNIAIAQIICSLADRRGQLKRTGEKRRVKVNTKPLAVFTTIGTMPLPLPTHFQKVPLQSAGDRLQGMINWMYTKEPAL